MAFVQDIIEAGMAKDHTLQYEDVWHSTISSNSSCSSDIGPRKVVLVLTIEQKRSRIVVEWCIAVLALYHVTTFPWNGWEKSWWVKPESIR